MVGKIPWNRGHGKALPYSCLENPHEQRSLAGCSPWCCRVGHGWAAKHTQATFKFYLISAHIQPWKRRWHPLLYSRLENPMDGGAWWAAVHGVAESDTAEQLHSHFPFSCLGEGNGNPLQCSCLGNPRDCRAWWAAVSGVAQSQTQLKRLSSSSSSSSIYSPWHRKRRTGLSDYTTTTTILPYSRHS